MKGLHDPGGHFRHLKSGIGIDDESLRRLFVKDAAARVVFVFAFTSIGRPRFLKVRMGKARRCSHNSQCPTECVR
jgi:hypothetical protein